MRYIKLLVFALIPVVVMALSGCGGSGGSSSSDPFSKSTGDNPGDQPPIFNNVSTATGKITLSLTTDVSTVDIDNGQVLAIAKVRAGENPVAGMPVAFSILAPTNLANVESPSVTTDSSGTAVTRITTGHTASTTNVLLSAKIVVGGKSITSNATFQLVRGGGVIMFTDKAGLDPGGQSNLYPLRTFTVDPGAWTYFELIPFKLTDSNGNPRVGVPVTLSVYSITSNPANVVIDYLVAPVTEPNQQTITTDSAGQGIFNTTLFMGMVLAKQTITTTVVYKAVTNESAGMAPVSAYLGIPYSVTGQTPTDTTAK